MKSIDLNADMGEGFPYDRELLLLITSANVCCGEHAGSWEITQTTVSSAKNEGVRIGAHPGYADRRTFGRGTGTIHDVPSLFDQLDRFIEWFNPSYIKPHGAFYNESLRPGFAEDALTEIGLRYGLPLMGLPATNHEAIAKRSGVVLIREGFADRGYTSDGLLIPRGEPGDLIDDEEQMIDQALNLAERVDSICIHGDSTKCVAFANRMRQEFERRGWKVGI